ncbi:MAG: hypothetical protein ABI635_09280 [Actinomycetota bacterium]
MEEWEEERFRRDALFAPLRLLAGLFAGGVVGMIGFGAVWAAFSPSGFDATLQALLVWAGASLATRALGAFMSSVRPVRRWWHLMIPVALGAVGGLLAGREFRFALLVDCLHGTGPQERWCMGDYSFSALLVASLIAGALVAGTLSAFGVRPGRRDAD